MSDVVGGAARAAADRLAAPGGALDLPQPAYDGRSLPNLSRTIVEAAGTVRARSPTGMLPPVAADLDPFRGRRAQGPVVHLLVDGLGWDAFARWVERDRPSAPAWTNAPRPITTVFPTSTVAALTSSSTAVAPGRHGLVGYRQYLPGFGAVADLLRMSPLGVPGQDLLVGSRWRPRHVSGARTIFQSGLSAVALSRDRFESSGFTRILYQGAPYAAYATAADLAHHLTRLLTGSSPARAVFAYWDELDTIQHLRGPNEGGLFDLEMAHVAGLLDYVARHVPRSVARATTVVITGDHGQVPATLTAQVRLERLPRVLREMARPVTGDRRAGFFAARPGRLPALQRALAPHLPPGSRSIPMEEAVAAGLFGPPPYHPELPARLGDLLVLFPSPSGVTQMLPGAPRPRRHLAGAHGGLDRAELLVPLVADSLAAFAAGRSAK